MFVDKEKYLSHSLDFKPEEIRLRDEFAEWLPDKIIDCHAHGNLPEHVDSISEKTYRHMLSTFPSFTIEESEHVKKTFYPGKQISTLRFASVFRGINHKKANSYLLKHSGPSDRVALFGLPEDLEYTLEMLGNKRVSALKMYYSYTEPVATKIYQCFNPKILKVAENLNIPIILHLPRIITESSDDLLQVTRDFPRLRIVIAHLGSTKFLIPGLKKVYEDLAQQTDIMLDTSLNPSAEVVELALRTFGSERIMFGSDEPFNLIRSRPYKHPEKGQRIITEYPYHWVDSDEHRQYAHLAKGVVHCHWLSLEALRTAISSFPESEQASIKEKIFYANAKEFFSF
jgi:hypothetical protein